LDDHLTQHELLEMVAIIAGIKMAAAVLKMGNHEEGHPARFDARWIAPVCSPENKQKCYSKGKSACDNKLFFRCSFYKRLSRTTTPYLGYRNVPNTIQLLEYIHGGGDCVTAVERSLRILRVETCQQIPALEGNVTEKFSPFVSDVAGAMEDGGRRPEGIEGAKRDG